jgi:FemAB-related protein, PEP-CTERM system-associated
VFSLPPFLNYGGVLAESEEAASFLLDSFVKLASELKVKYIEMRSLEKLGFFRETREHKVTMWLKLENSVEKQWLNLNAKIRNEVRKAEKSGLSIKAGKGELLDSFYAVFSRNMRDLGTPVLGKIFFKNILKHFPEEANIFIATLENKPIAAAFSLSHGSSMEVPWASSIKDFNRVCPNEFIYWHIIKYAIEKNMDRFDFGRCTKGSGTYRFKKQWAPEEKQLYWQYWEADGFRLSPEDPKHGSFSPLIQIWKRLPLCIANNIGPAIARHLTTF